MAETLYHTQINTPLGPMEAIASAKGVCLLEFASRKELDKEKKALEAHFDSELINEKNTHLELLSDELAAYFKGELLEFTVPIVLNGTAFQKKVWQALLEVPYGETRTYMEQTKIIGDPKAIRAVATANGKNQIAILVPCHRIIGSDGSLTGYAGGIENKRALLNLEREIAGPRDLFNQ